MKERKLAGLSVILVSLSFPILVLAQHDAGVPQPENFDSLYPGKAYSPWAERAFPSQVYWGETHLHTGLSLMQDCLAILRGTTRPAAWPAANK